MPVVVGQDQIDSIRTNITYACSDLGIRISSTCFTNWGFFLNLFKKLVNIRISDLPIYLGRKWLDIDLLQFSIVHAKNCILNLLVRFQTPSKTFLFQFCTFHPRHAHRPDCIQSSTTTYKWDLFNSKHSKQSIIYLLRRKQKTDLDGTILSILILCDGILKTKWCRSNSCTWCHYQMGSRVGPPHIPFTCTTSPSHLLWAQLSCCSTTVQCGPFQLSPLSPPLQEPTMLRYAQSTQHFRSFNNNTAIQKTRKTIQPKEKCKIK